MSFAQFLAILRARWLAPTITLAVLITIALLAGFLMPPKYTAEGSVVVESRSPDPITGTLTQQTPITLTTQMDIVRSHRVARMVIKNLKLSESPELRTLWQEGTGGNGDFEAWIAELLLKSLEVEPERGSSVFNVSFTGSDPQFASTLVNEFVRAYIEVNVELRSSPAKQFTSMFNQQQQEARDKLEAAQRKLSAFQQQKGIIATDERIDVETARLNELSAQLVSLQSATADASSRRNQAGIDSPDSMNSSVIMGLKTDLARQQAALKQESSRLGENHPSIGQLKAGIAEIQERIRNESVAVGRSSGVSLDIARQREGQVRASLEAQRTRVLQLKAIRDEMSLLARDVESAQRAFEGISLRANQTSLESQINQTNAAVLKYATPPTGPSSPRKVMFVLQAIFIGLFLGIGIAVVRELRDRRLRVDEDLAELIGAENLGSMPAAKPKSSKTLPIRFVPQLPDKAVLRLPTNPQQS